MTPRKQARLARLLERVSRIEKSILLAVMLIAGGLYGFVALAGEIFEGDTHAFDSAILLAFRDPADPSDPIGPHWFEELVRDVTALGSFTILILLTLTVFGFLFLSKKRQAAWLMLGAIASGILMSQTLKWGFARPRPDLVPHGTMVFTNSFPSGHAMLSAVVYLTMGVLLARAQPRVRLKVYLVSVALLLTVVVGASRVYLGVHWPTDVLAGWAVGSAWALLCWLLMLRLQARGKIEEPRERDD
jgi:undecaprenyl-diphosphatase